MIPSEFRNGVYFYENTLMGLLGGERMSSILYSLLQWQNIG